ncbi:hypothetical protein Hanom_Chr07g00616671 [Helianthus anomalus]
MCIGDTLSLLFPLLYCFSTLLYLLFCVTVNLRLYCFFFHLLLYKAKMIKVRQKWNIVKTLNDRMATSIESQIRQTCFGPYLDIKCVMCESLFLLGVAQLQVHTPIPKLGIPYRLGQETLMFTPKQLSNNGAKVWAH